MFKIGVHATYIAMQLVRHLSKSGVNFSSMVRGKFINWSGFSRLFGFTHSLATNCDSALQSTCCSTEQRFIYSVCDTHQMTHFLARPLQYSSDGSLSSMCFAQLLLCCCFQHGWREDPTNSSVSFELQFLTWTKWRSYWQFSSFEYTLLNKVF